MTDIADQVRKRITPSDAVGELLCVCLLGTLPLLFFCVVGGIGKESLSSSAVGFFDPISKGQLFLYLFALFGSLTWIFVNQIRAYNKLWLGIYIVWLVGPALLSMFVYGDDPSQTNTLDPVWTTLSVILFGSYIWLYYRLLVHIPDRIENLNSAMEKTSGDAAEKARGLIR